jgi:uncharacterized protein involved in exopolysaccharide biosynthesis
VEQADELELADYLAILRRRWTWVVVPLAVVLVAALAYTLLQDKVYRSTTSVLLGSSAAEDAVARTSSNAQLLTRELSNEISYATSDAIEGAVEQRLGRLPDIDVAADPDADLLRFTGSAEDADEAATVANTWADVYVAQKQADALASITAATDQLSARLTQLRTQRQEVRAPLDQAREELAALPEPVRQRTRVGPPSSSCGSPSSRPTWRRSCS